MNTSNASLRKSKFRPSILSTSRYNKDTRTTNNSNNPYEKSVQRFKAILLGDIGVGKTSILNKIIYDKFSENYNCTMSVECLVQTFKIDEIGNKADVLIWDTCGEERYRTITRQYYQEANGICLLFDLTKKETFENLPSWLSEIRTTVGEKTPVILCGNKSDMFSSRQVGFIEAENYARENGLKYYEISAKTGNMVNYVFEELLIGILGSCDEKTIMDMSRGKIKEMNSSIMLDSSHYSTKEQIFDKKRKKCLCS